jgi:hypothetical protein
VHCTSHAKWFINKGESMKISKLILAILALTFASAACQIFGSGTAPATEVVATEAPAPTAAGGVPYPEGSAVALPVISGGANPYPGSDVPDTPLDSGAYPDAAATALAAAALAYPSPVAQSLTAQSEPVLPELKDGAEVQWSQAEKIVFSGQVVSIGQTHDLNVTITLEDGRTFKTVEPEIDDILKLVQACGDLCKDIKVATE